MAIVSEIEILEFMGMFYTFFVLCMNFGFIILKNMLKMILLVKAFAWKIPMLKFLRALYSLREISHQNCFTNREFLSRVSV